MQKLGRDKLDDILDPTFIHINIIMISVEIVIGLALKCVHSYMRQAVCRGIDNR